MSVSNSCFKQLQESLFFVMTMLSWTYHMFSSHPRSSEHSPEEIKKSPRLSAETNTVLYEALYEFYQKQHILSCQP